MTTNQNRQAQEPPQVIPMPRHDNIAPYDKGAEQSLLGSILINPLSFAVVEQMVEAADFWSIRNAHIWRAFQHLYDKQMAIDIVTVNSALMELGTAEESGGLLYMTELAGKTPTSVNVDTYARTVQRLGTRRKIAQQARQLEAAALNPAESVELIEQHIQTLDTTFGRTHEGGLEMIGDVADEHVADIKRLAKEQNQGIKTGLYDIDRLTGGVWPRSIMWLVGRPEMGKTALAHTIALNAALKGKRVALYNVGDASKNEIMTRMASIISKVPAAIIGSGQMNQEQWAAYIKAMNQIAALPMHIDSQIGASPGHINKSASAIHARNPFDVIIIDYFQSMRMRSKKLNGRYEMLLEISQAVTRMADEKHLNVPIIIGAQAGRQVDSRDDKQPQMSDIKGCGEAEQDATIIVTIYRPCVSDVTYQHKTEARLLVAKNKQTGRRGLMTVRFDVNTTEFQSIARQ